MLTTPLGGTWMFSSEGAEVAIESSVFFAGVAGPQRSKQIVLHLGLANEARVHWVFQHKEPVAA